MNLRKLSNVVHLTLLFSLLAYTVLFGQATTKTKTLEALAKLSNSFETLAMRVSPAVVQILASGYVTHQGVVPSTANLVSRQRSTGSGVILAPNGYIITNTHVVEGARRIQVALPAPLDEKIKQRSILKSKGKIVGAQIVGVDRETDLAVLKVQEKSLPFLQLGDSDEVKQGQLVFAFGSPLGLENSVTMGIVSSVARQLRSEDPMIYIQTDATINPGNSGGPLVNSKGQVIGINIFIFTQSGGSEGIGFAAPSNIVRNVFEQIRTTGQVRRGEIGVYAQTVTPILAAGLELPRNWGVILGDVYPEGPADKAGLQVGDLVLTLDRKIMENGRQFDVNLYRRAIGDTVTLEVLRKADTLTTRVAVIERPDDPDRFAALVTPEKNLIPNLGILGIELDHELLQMLPPLKKQTGVLVAARAADTPYWEDGFQTGDIIYAINGVAIKSLAQLRSAVAAIKLYEPVIVQIDRRGRSMYLAFELE